MRDRQNAGGEHIRGFRFLKNMAAAKSGPTAYSLAKPEARRRTRLIQAGGGLGGRIGQPNPVAQRHGPDLQGQQCKTYRESVLERPAGRAAHGVGEIRAQP